MDTKRLFALDIGTRSVIGVVGELRGRTIRVIDTERREHNTRAMLDGQIHDVPEVAHVLGEVKAALEERCGPLKQAAVAAAGRALYTVKAEAEIDAAGVLKPEDEKTLEFAAIQNAQQKLASSNAVDDPTMYYCVGSSTITFSLDGTPLKTLVGQRGRKAGIKAIATFLPCQVIDSMQSALQDVDLEMTSLTLEPIAGINVLVPSTMRHLNLVLVDVGAGTSDIAITNGGAVIGYGMAPYAGDEITEAISQQYLLDFNVAEKVKRQLNEDGAPNIRFADILGLEHSLPAAEIIAEVTPAILELAQLIARQILELNERPPQAVLLVGGGSLTPLLPEALAQALDIPPARVAIRRPDAIADIEAIPPALASPDAVTPLGILKLASRQSLHFVHVTVNDRPARLFNFSRLTIADALLAAGVDIRGLQGKHGLGMTIKINGRTQFIAGTMGTAAKITRNGDPAELNDPLQDGDILTATPGENGANPRQKLRDLQEIPAPLPLFFNGRAVAVAPRITVNQEICDDQDRLLEDRDVVSCRLPETVQEALLQLYGASPAQTVAFTVNGAKRSHTLRSRILLNGGVIESDAKLRPHDRLDIEPERLPTVGDALGLDDTGDFITVHFNAAPCRVPIRRRSVKIDGAAAGPADLLHDGCRIEYDQADLPAPMISDVLLAAQYNPRRAAKARQVDILLNGRPAEFTTPVNPGDSVDVRVDYCD